MRHSNPLVQPQTLEKPRGTNLTVGSRGSSIYTVWWAHKSLLEKKKKQPRLLNSRADKGHVSILLPSRGKKQQQVTRDGMEREREKGERKKRKRKNNRCWFPTRIHRVHGQKGNWVDERGRLERTRLHAAGRDKFCERTAWKVERAHRALCCRT